MKTLPPSDRSGVDVSRPGTQPHTGDGYICPAGHFCPEQTSEEEECEPGTFNPTVFCLTFITFNEFIRGFFVPNVLMYLNLVL